MVRYHFKQGDLLRTRFAIAPLMELIAAVYVVRDPARSAVHRPWVEWAGPRVAGLDLSLLEAAAPVTNHGFWPVFVGPPPRAPHAQFTDELARVRATPLEQVVDEITHAYPGGVPSAAQVFLTDPDAALERLVEQMRAFWDAVLAPWWPRVSAALEAEISARARALVALGPQAAFTGLHQTVWWEDGIVYVHPTRKAAADVDLADRGLLLVPAVFTWPRVWPRTDPPWDPALVYPPPGTADVWRPDPPRPEALKALLGHRRAQILLELDRPACTLQLAQRMQVSAGSVNSHLFVLWQAGLVSRRREGRRVIYTRTTIGDTLGHYQPR